MENITGSLNQTLHELKKIIPPEIPLWFKEAYLGQVSTQKFQVKSIFMGCIFNKKKIVICDHWSIMVLILIHICKYKNINFCYYFVTWTNFPGTRTFRAGLDFPGLGPSPTKKCLLHKGIKSRTTAIFVIFLKRIFLKITVSITLKVVNRLNNKSVLVTNLLFAIIFHKKVIYLVKLAPYLKTCIMKIKNCLSLKEYFYCV